MSPRLRRVLTVSASIALGATGGVLLGNFALSGVGAQSALTGAEELRALGGNSAAGEAQSRTDLSPERYECQGCDASPINQAAMADGWQPFDSRPLPPYRSEDAPLPPPPPQAVRLPVLAADRDAARPDVPPAVRGVPVLAADGASGGAPPAEPAVPATP